MAEVSWGAVRRRGLRALAIIVVVVVIIPIKGAGKSKGERSGVQRHLFHGTKRGIEHLSKCLLCVCMCV